MAFTAKKSIQESNLTTLLSMYEYLEKEIIVHNCSLSAAFFLSLGLGFFSPTLFDRSRYIHDQKGHALCYLALKSVLMILQEGNYYSFVINRGSNKRWYINFVL